MNNGPADLKLSVAAVLQRYSSQLAGTTVLLALSGGADSVSLLYISATLQKQFGFLLRCIHVNHRLRPVEETDIDANIVRAHCQKLKVPLTIVNIAPGVIESYAEQHKTGIEAAARHFRYRALKRQMRRWSGTWLFLGHTRDDALELALMRFLRGAGPNGLARLPERRGNIVRPLVYTSRAEIEDYVRDRNIEYVYDSTNRDNHYLRNRIRNVLIPLLDREFPFWRTGVLEASFIQSQVSFFLKDAAQNNISWQGFVDSTLQGYQTVCENFFKQPLMVREEALFRAIDVVSSKKSEAFSLNYLNPDGIKLGCAKTVRRSSVRKFALGEVQTLDLPNCRLIRSGEWVKVQEKPQLVSATGFSMTFTTSGTYRVKNVRISIQPMQALVPDRTKTNGQMIFLPCVFRTPQAGDRIMYRGRMRTLAEVRQLEIGDTRDEAYRSEYYIATHYIFEDTLGIAVYMLIDIHSKVHIYWREPVSPTVEKIASFMLEIQIRGNHARRSKR
ncbi:tRNA lysidine(34) synthetase TilS [Gracilinema caldarium]|uniref:tRNA(Ile)-lysidine synthase n=1 Tax=Gracilinema caldarium (strain ATCC 51460 / DSM 7334 / H1) TaxID=744872 RepID=F8F083_GRAC1|nr:tRNA lysidine(34) synthetase TilS [Gracilinema caldarium]AEJ18947.1 tRNA(Ile)-lysidine synthase [Gracilinema caldarium DSM 7334]